MTVYQITKATATELRNRRNEIQGQPARSQDDDIELELLTEEIDDRDFEARVYRPSELFL